MRMQLCNYESLPLFFPACNLTATAAGAAATGHQRIMEKEDQADPMSDAGETWTESVLREVQAHDFESGLCIFNGMHAIAGFLPVVPGECS